MHVKYSIECKNGQLILRLPLSFLLFLYHLPDDDTETERFFTNLDDAILSTISNCDSFCRKECDGLN